MSVGEYLKPANPPLTAASDIAAKAIVGISTASGFPRCAVPLTAVTSEPFGVVGQATYLRTEAVTSYGDGAVVDLVACASLGVGADVGIASTNGQLGPVVGASGVSRFRVGKALEPAAAGDTFSVYVSRKQLSNLI